MLRTFGAKAKHLLTILPMCLGILAAGPAAAQGYPTRPIRYIMPTTGQTEIIGRLIAPGMSEVLGQQVYVDVRAGAGGNIGAELAARASPDGYTLVQLNQSHTVNMSLYPGITYDVQRDFAPVTLYDVAPQMVVCHPSLPVKSIAELVRLARAKPGAIGYASAGPGTSTYLAAELFKNVARVDMLEVPYKGGGPALLAVLSGEVSLYFSPLATALPHVRSGKLRALAAGTRERLPLLPALPTVAESGYPGYEAGNWHGLAVPAGAPQDLIAKLHSAAIAALKRPDIRKRMLDLGLTVVGNTPGEFAAFIRGDVEKWGKLVASLRHGSAPAGKSQ